MAEEVAPKNILMIGPTGVGKTEIARRLARLCQSAFSQVARPSGTVSAGVGVVGVGELPRGRIRGAGGRGGGARPGGARRQHGARRTYPGTADKGAPERRGSAAR